jgi:hypothetical protein
MERFMPSALAIPNEQLLTKPCAILFQRTDVRALRENLISSHWSFEPIKYASPKFFPPTDESNAMD